MQLNKEQKYKILFLSDEGLSGSEIAKKSGFPKTTVNNLLKKHRETGSIEHRKGNGRPKAINFEALRFIKEEICGNPKLSLRKMEAKVSEKLGKRISHMTIKNHLNSENLKAFSPVKKPLLSLANIKKRKHCAREIIKMPEDDVKRIIFSDESKFNLFYSDGKQFVWREPGSALESKNLIKTVKHGGGSVMVWACFSYYGVGKLVFIEENMTAAVYVNILSKNLFESASEMGLEDFIFQQDNDPKHTSKLAAEYFDEQGIDMVEWPPQSPDLNPIEHLWAYIKVKVAQRSPKNIRELKSIIIEEWGQIPVEMCQKYALSFKNRALAIFEASGKHTRY